MNVSRETAKKEAALYQRGLLLFHLLFQQELVIFELFILQMLKTDDGASHAELRMSWRNLLFAANSEGSVSRVHCLGKWGASPFMAIFGVPILLCLYLFHLVFVCAFVL